MPSFVIRPALTNGAPFVFSWRKKRTRAEKKKKMKKKKAARRRKRDSGRALSRFTKATKEDVWISSNRDNAKLRTREPARETRGDTWGLSNRRVRLDMKVGWRGNNIGTSRAESRTLADVSCTSSVFPSRRECPQRLNDKRMIINLRINLVCFHKVEKHRWV